MVTYDNYITEFVDWVSGKDTSQDEAKEVSRASSTGGLPVSGKYIRELLQSRLKKPFVSYEDKTAGLYRMFSSAEAREQWIRMNNPESSYYDPDGSAYLELFNFVRPADVILTQEGLDANPKYIISGDSTSEAATLRYKVKIRDINDENNILADAFTVTYIITNSQGIERTIVEEFGTFYSGGSDNSWIEKNIYSYLTTGINNIVVSMQARNSSASTRMSFAVYLVDFLLESSFRYNNHWSKDQSISIPVSITRSDDSLSLTVRAEIDGVPARLASNPLLIAELTWSQGGTRPTTTFDVLNTYASNETNDDHIIHKLKIYATMEGSNHTVYNSNVLYFDFIVASSADDIDNKFITTKYSVPFSKINTHEGQIVFNMTQYEPFSLDWSYYTDNINKDQSVNIQWSIREDAGGISTYSPITIASGSNGNVSETLKFIPDFYTSEYSSVYLVALYNGKELAQYPIIVQKSPISVVETSEYMLKLQAYGRSNVAADKDIWEDKVNNILAQFVGIDWDNNSGWNENSFITSGIGSYASINYNPFPITSQQSFQGETIEIDFMPDRVVNEDDVLISIGDPSRGNIKICTNKATVYNGGNEILHTNYKANERIKLAFVFNTENAGKDSTLVFIINNGTLERAASWGSTFTPYQSSNGTIKIGDCASSVRVYNIRAYHKSLSTSEELNNYIYDSSNKAEIVNRNDIFSASLIDYNLVRNKIDTVLLTGDLSKILTMGTGKEESESTINFKRECITDASKTFEVLNGMIRKHGQSTLNYPITSMKIWTNKASNPEITPSITLSESQKSEGLAKNRYIMKSGAIPSNKFVLQANYADSSGVHNGSLLRLIQDTWYNANIDGKFILRTAPQLFTSNQILVHNDTNLYEDGSWVEGYSNVPRVGNKTWKDISGNDTFPYVVRNAPDSFPCAVFYKNGPDDGYHFLGQYVFMDDKKSDYIYGERSIYFFDKGTDPFVLRTENTKNGANGKQDTSENCVWDNTNVLRIEIVIPNLPLSSFMSLDYKGHDFMDIETNEAGNQTKFYWENCFELIYPDEDDVAADDEIYSDGKFNINSKFRKKTKPFIDFLRWITDCNNNYNKTTDWWSAGQYSSRQEAFEHTASQHLDLYKVAAYYIFFLRFGLVDSVERNAQLKTYDGKHWHYEPWDMDIALGNTNQGALVLDPPIDRNTFEPGTRTYAFSGRSEKDGRIDTSNVLWDCLEAWDYWSNTLVPKVADALNKAGLEYNNIMKMFDGEYAEKWSESMYNQSGHFKYIENGDDSWYSWLQGSRTSHRHWWVSTSMNYYDAKWACGSFKDHRIALTVDKSANSPGTDIITIKPTSKTFFKLTQGDTTINLGFKEADPNNPAIFDISANAFSAKDPAHIFGGNFIEEIDLSCLAQKMKVAEFSSCYDEVLGAPIKKLNIGISFTEDGSTVKRGSISGTKLTLSGYSALTDTDAFASLQELNITGQGNIDLNNFLRTYNRKNVTKFNAIGTKISSFSSSVSGNKFEILQLPAKTTISPNPNNEEETELTSFVMNNSSWQTLEFWNAKRSGEFEYVLDENGNPIEEDGQYVVKPNIAEFTKVDGVPSSITTVEFTGSTATNECAAQFVKDWLASIERDFGGDLNNLLHNRSFVAENINWGGPNKSIKFYYDDVVKLGRMQGAKERIKGYIMLSDKNELSAEQLGTLIELFGPNVFTKGNQNAGLVVDQELTYTRITFLNTEVIDGRVSLREGNDTVVKATKFILSETDSSNYEWTISAINPSTGGEMTGSVGNMILSSELYMGNDGLVHIRSRKSGIYTDGGGGYDLKVSVYVDGVTYTETVRIIAAKLPESMSIRTVGVAGSDNARMFYLDNNLVSQSSLFDEVRDTYILFKNGQQVEFYPNFSENPDSEGYAGLSNIFYSLIVNGQDRGEMSYTQLTGLENTEVNNSYIISDYFYYTKSASQKGIVLGLKQPPSEMQRVTLNIRAVVGDKSYMTSINIVIYDDSNIIYATRFGGDVNTVQVLANRFNEIYNTSKTEFYKSDLQSIYGTLDFSINPNVATLTATDGNPLIKYLQNVTELIFDGCVNVSPTGAYFGESTSSALVFQPMPNLKKLSFAGCGGEGVINFTNCPNVTYLDLSGTSVGFIQEGGSLETLKLGNPSTIDISNPKRLYYGNVTIENNSRFKDPNGDGYISLINVNVGDAIANVQRNKNSYRLFDLIYPNV